MMKEKSKSNINPKTKTKSKSNSLKRSLSMLKGGEDVQPKEENKSSFFDFLNKREDKKPEATPPLSNGPDMDADADADKGITFKSNKLLSILYPSEAASVASSSGEEAPASTWWFVFRVIVVLLIVLVFTLNLTGYLDNIVALIKQFFDTNIAPLLVSIGLMKTTPVVADRTGASLPGSDSSTGSNTINQLDQNIGTKPVTTTPPNTTSTTASTPGPALTDMSRAIPSLKPIPIQPNERRTPLQNKGESVRPPASPPAAYEEETSREKQKQESVKKALEYALKNQTPVADDATSSTQIPRSKPGYCYIGEDRGFRSCIEVSQDMKCMSGDIFPTMDVCVNPRLRV
jgi:hypothetical protein